jgi:hypothetical protein
MKKIIILILLIISISCQKINREDSLVKIQKDLDNCGCNVQYGFIVPQKTERKIFIQVKNGISSIAFTSQGNQTKILKEARRFFRKKGCNISIK